MSQPSALSPERQRMKDWVERQRMLHPPFTPLSLPEAEHTIVPPEAPGSGISVEFIQRAVAAYYRISFEDIIGDRRTKKILLPRQVAMYLAAKMTKRKFPDLGRRFGGKDHTTVLHAKAKIAWLVGDREHVYESIRDLNLPEEVDAELAQRVAHLEQAILTEWNQGQPALAPTT